MIEYKITISQNFKNKYQHQQLNSQPQPQRQPQHQQQPQQQQQHQTKQFINAFLWCFLWSEIPTADTISSRRAAATEKFYNIIVLAAIPTAETVHQSHQTPTNKQYISHRKGMPRSQQFRKAARRSEICFSDVKVRCKSKISTQQKPTDRP